MSQAGGGPRERDSDNSQITRDTSRINALFRQIAFGRDGRGSFGINAIKLMAGSSPTMDTRLAKLKLSRARVSQLQRRKNRGGVICIRPEVI